MRGAQRGFARFKPTIPVAPTTNAVFFAIRLPKKQVLTTFLE
jgi:hypothetical protein